MKAQAALFFLLSAAVLAHCYLMGAPAEACADIYPRGHAGHSLNCSTSPFQLSLSDFNETYEGEFYYTPGQQYLLTLSGFGDEQFRGFLVQARTVADGSPVGVFTESGADYNLSNCTPAESAVTHISNDLKSSVTFTWSAPSQGTEEIMFLFAVVVHNSGEVSTFYATCTTDIIHNSCTGDTCQNGGTCSQGGSCICSPGFTGQFCSEASLCPSEKNVPAFSGSTILYDWGETEAGQSRSHECPGVCNDFISQMPNGRVVRECLQLEDGSVQWKESYIAGCGLGFAAFQICEASQLNNTMFLDTVVNITSVSSNLDSSVLTICGNIVSTFTQLAAQDTVIQERYLEIIDNILVANRSNLLESQKESNTSTKILQSLKNFQNLVVLDPGIGNLTFTHNNFAIVLMDSYSPHERPQSTFRVSLGSAEEGVCNSEEILQDQISVPSDSTAIVTGSITLHRCNDNTVPRHISYSLFRTDALFLTPATTSGQYTIGSVILGVNANGTEMCDVTVNLQPVTETCDGMRIRNAEIFYAFWDAEKKEWIPETSFGEGSISEFSQLGHFGLLFDFKNEESISPLTLAVISYIGAIFSIICLLVVVVTYVLSRNLRQSDHGQILIHLSFSLICLYVVFMIAGLVTAVKYLCGLVSALFQYFMLVFFGWTAAEALYLFRKLVTVHAASIRNFVPKVLLVVLIGPLLIVTISVGAGHQYYVNNYYCRATNWPFWFGHISPFCVIYVFNWVIFIIIMIKLLGRNVPGEEKSSRKRKIRTFKQNFTIALGLSLLFGLGWGFGLSATSTNVKELTFALQIIFSLFVGSQGLILLIFHVLRSQEARKVWQPLFICCKKNQKHQITFSGSTQKKQTSFFQRSPTSNSGTQPPSSSIQSDPTTKRTAVDLEMLADSDGDNTSMNTMIENPSKHNDIHSGDSVDSRNGAGNVFPSQDDEDSSVTSENHVNDSTAGSDNEALKIVEG